jgi:hypothetical protein
MKRLISISIVLLALVFTGSLHRVRAASATQVASSPAFPVEPMIVRLVSRDKSITIFAGPGHSLYSATDAAGKTIVSKATLDELKTSHPDLYQRVAPGVTAYAGL